MNESEVIARTQALPELYADRVPPVDLDGLRSMASGGEWLELVDLLIASLRDTQAKVTASERDELRSLLEAMDMPTSPLSALNVEG
jgi:hypothetical protein